MGFPEHHFEIMQEPSKSNWALRGIFASLSLRLISVGHLTTIFSVDFSCCIIYFHLVLTRFIRSFKFCFVCFFPFCEHEKVMWIFRRKRSITRVILLAQVYSQGCWFPKCSPMPWSTHLWKYICISICLSLTIAQLTVWQMKCVFFEILFRPFQMRKVYLKT